MKNQEFEEIRDKIVNDTEVLIRYYTYNKNDYIDIIGKVALLYGIGKCDKGSYYFTIEYLGTYKTHKNFVEKNIPSLRTYLNRGKVYCNLYSNMIESIKFIPLRSIKIQQLRNKI
jgi:hypothetical protein